MKIQINILYLTLILFSKMDAQFKFNKVYESQRKQYRSVEGMFTNAVSFLNGDVFLGSIAWSLDSPNYYAYTFINQINNKGELLWSKTIGDSLGYYYPSILDTLPNKRFLWVGENIIKIELKDIIGIVSMMKILMNLVPMNIPRVTTAPCFGG